MSPTEFSNYIKQRQMQQHNHFHPHPHPQNSVNGIFGAVSPARSISPNPMTLQMPPNDQSMQTSPHQQQQNSFVFQNNGFGLNMYPIPGRNVMDNSYQYNGNSNGNNDPLLFMSGNNKCSSYLDQQNYCKIPNQQQQQPNQTPAIAPQQQTNASGSGTVNSGNSSNSNNTNSSPGAGNQQSPDNKLLDQGMNSFYSSSNSSYQHLLVAN